MAAVLDINIISKEIIDFDVIIDLMNDYGVNISSITSISNWKWEKERQIRSVEQIPAIIDSGEIVIIQLKFPPVKDMGIYIEKSNNICFYTLWMNTEGYPAMDCDIVNSENRVYYEKIYRAVQDSGIGNESIFGIGLETDICYAENIMDMIQNSKNIAVWIMNSDIEMPEEIKGYQKIVNASNRMILERNNCKI